VNQTVPNLAKRIGRFGAPNERFRFQEYVSSFEIRDIRRRWKSKPNYS